MNNYCKYYCTAPDTLCPYWIGISCELEEFFYEEYKYIIDYLNFLENE